jgi:hypothetical protein
MRPRGSLLAPDRGSRPSPIQSFVFLVFFGRQGRRFRDQGERVPHMDFQVRGAGWGYGVVLHNNLAGEF